MFSGAGVRVSSIAVSLALIFLLIAPAIAFAQIPTIVPCNGTDCSLCHIGQLAQNILNGGIYIAVFLSAILFAYAGWQYITAGGEPGKASEAKKIFWNVGVGLIIILGAWLIVDMIMGILTSREKLFGPWNEICMMLFQQFLA